MGRVKSITPLVCAHSHFTYEERLQLEFYLLGTGKFPKVTNLTMLGTLLQGRRRRPHCGKRNHRNAALAAKCITYRPEDVSTRQEFGHWEGDTVVSGKGKGSECLLTITERKTRMEISRRMPDRTAQSVIMALDAIERELGAATFRSLFRSITFDNGSEFQDIEGIEDLALSRKKRTEIFFAHPYCASERGSNERHNGIFRRFIPKGAAIRNFSRAEIRDIQEWMNNYPRKILNGSTPAQKLSEEFPDRTMILKFFNIIPKEIA